MKKFISIIILLILTACGAKQVPTLPPESTSTSLPRIFATIVMPATEAQVVPTVVLTDTPAVTATSSQTNQRFSLIDGMPQVFIPEGKFRMGGMDVHASDNEKPAHDVTLDAFWMDQLEVTNGIYALCVSAGACQPPILNKSHKIIRRGGSFGFLNRRMISQICRGQNSHGT